MVQTRETRASACEIKFLVDPDDAPRILAWARAELQPDPYGAGPFGDEYETTSLYFDTDDLDVFHRRGSFGRAKYRIRRYGGSDIVFLERKLRKPGILVKRRTADVIDALARLETAEGDPGWRGEWFRRRLLARRLRPVCQVSYHRAARVIVCTDGLARLTLDGGLRAVSIDAPAFAGGAGVPVLEDRMILELKYCVRVPAIFRRLVEAFALEPQAASKYRLSMAALGHASPVALTGMISGTNASYA